MISSSPKLHSRCHPRVNWGIGFPAHGLLGAHGAKAVGLPRRDKDERGVESSLVVLPSLHCCFP